MAKRNLFLQKEIFELFKNQLKKDFETAGLNTEFISMLRAESHDSKALIEKELEPLFKKNSTVISNLLYRVDISELQISKYRKMNPKMNFEEIITELIIKRILQKVILKKKFSNG